MSKRIILVFVFLQFGAFIWGQTYTELFDKINREVKSKYVPDSRDKVYEVKLIEKDNTIILQGVTTEPEAKEELINNLKNIGLTPYDQIKLLPEEDLNGRIYGVVCMSVASFNGSNGFSAESGTQALAGMPVKVLEKSSNGWYRCINMEGYIAWTITNSVAAMTKDEYNAYIEQPKYIVTVPYSTIYSAASTSSLPVSDLVLGAIVVDDERTTNNPIYEKYIDSVYSNNLNAGYNLSKNRKHLKKTNGWCRVHLADGRAGYVRSSDIKRYDEWIKDRLPTKENIVQTAKLFLGWPYVWGGTSIKGIDCSGLSKTVYYLNGYVLMRDASQQCKTGDHIDISDFVNGDYSLKALKNLEPGDLIFFGRKGDKNGVGERITHVAIYIGEGKIIHSSNVVRMNSLIPSHSNYYSGSKNIVRARRIIGTADSEKKVWSVKKILENKID